MDRKLILPYSIAMVTSLLENATVQVRLYPTDYLYFKGLAEERRTSIAQIIHELKVEHRK